MSKRFRGKTCVYCAEEGISSTGDHVFAREFFPADKRGNLPIVAACIACNNAKSALEHYLTAVLPIAGQHPDSTAMLVNDVPRRLAKNQKLYRSLIEGAARLELTLNGSQPVEHLAVPFDSNKLNALMGYVARGLAAYHWGVIVPAAYEVEALMLNPRYEPHFQRLFRMLANAHAWGAIGGDAFLYEGAQAVDDPALTMWRFQVFGGIYVAGDPNVPNAGAPTMWVTTARFIPRN